MFRHIDLFSGYLGFSESFRSVFGDDYELVAACEIEKACQHIIRRHRPGVEIIPDVTQFDGRPYRGTIDLVSFGSPCQDLSVAGNRSGLAGERSGLFFEAIRIIKEVRPEWFVFENVPGLLSSNGGRDMGTVLWEFSQLGYWWSYRNLDLQHFGCPQRRERVFAVGHIRERTYPPAVLFEPESLCRNTPKGGKTGEEVAGSLGGGSGKRGWCDDTDRCGAFVPEVVGTLAPNCGPNSHDAGNFHCNQAVDAGHIIVHTLRAEYDASEDGTGRGTPLVPVAFSCKDDGRDVGVVSPTLRSMEFDGSHINGGGQVAVAFAQNQRGELGTSEVAPQLDGGGGIPGQGYAAVKQGMSVRRLLPIETERLQGLPDGWTAWGINEAGERVELSDSARYRMIGNGVGLPVVKWIAERLSFFP